LLRNPQGRKEKDAPSDDHSFFKSGTIKPVNSSNRSQSLGYMKLYHWRFRDNFMIPLLYDICEEQAGNFIF
jgi:hypothetical protein